MFHMHLRGWFLAAASLLLLVSPRVVSGQDDPFGFGAAAGSDDAGLFGGAFDTSPEAAAPATPPAEIEPVSPLVAQLRLYAAGTPRQLGIAIREATRLGLWDELETYLNKPRIDALSPLERAHTAETVGGALLARAASVATLGEPARESVALLRQAAAATAVDPATLDAAIAKLGSASVDDRLGAIRTLLRGGDPALVRLVEAAAAADPPAPRERLLEVLRGFDDAAFEALAQLALYGAEPLRAEALEMLAALDLDRAIPLLVSALHGQTVSSAERDVAAAALLRIFPSLPTRLETETYLLDRLQQANRAYSRTDYGVPAEGIWQIDETQASVQRVVPTSPVAAARGAVDAAAMLRRLGELRPTTLSAAVRADLRYRVLIDPVFGTDASLEWLQSSWGEAAADPDFLSRALADALGDAAPGKRVALGGVVNPAASEGDPAAAIVIMRIMAALGDADVVYSNGQEPSPLVAAAAHALPRVRFEAASTIGTLAPDRPYVHSSQVLDRWMAMSQLDDAPLALLMIHDAESARVLNAHLDQLGYRVVRVPSASRLVEAVEDGGDLQLIVATTTPPDMTAVEMVDRVRRRPLGGAVPLLLIGPPTDALVTVADRWGAPLEQIALPRTLPALSSTVQSMVNELPLPPLSPAERELFALDALTILSQLTAEPDARQLYDLRRHEGGLVEASQRSGFSGPSLAVLSSLGTPESQALLATLAANPSLDADLRQRAAEAFAASVQRFGTRLSRQQVAQQYDRFNAADSEEERAAIGRILDVMESRVGVSTKR